MAGLKNYISSDYVNAANKLQGRRARRRIVAYVESYDDVLFWRMVLSQFEDETRYFEVMLPTRETLNRGKKQALLAMMSQGAGENMIACVDADYDYLMQGVTPLSAFMLNNPYVIHTYAYAIENYQCYAPSLHNVCVMSTLNDNPIFDFVDFLTQYSRIIFPLFVWSVMAYRTKEYSKFSLTDFNSAVSMRHSRIQDVQYSLEKLRGKVRIKVQDLRKKMPGMKEEYLKTKDSLLALGVTPETTYLYVQGHHLFDSIVAPMMHVVCDELRREREREIRAKAIHNVQMQNELSAYQRSQSDVQSMMKKNPGYTHCLPYRKMMADVEKLFQIEN